MIDMDGVYEYQMRTPYFAASPEIPRTATYQPVAVKAKLAIDYSMWAPLVAGVLLLLLAKRA